MKVSISLAKVRLAVLSVILSALVSYFAQPMVHANDQAINVVVTVFSVLAGFLVAIIAIIGDPALLPPGSWRAAEMERDKLDGRIVRHKWLFIAYLITLGLIFSALVVSKNMPDATVWLERLFLFFGTFSFILSLQLPNVLMRVQRERIDAVIEHRRSLDKIPKS
ncbi:hypothetical protein WNB94_10755 [Aquabacterium sp. A3]|uniref:hypothetical protein n=1 Tax=Aquabacterium sp. A3 TaxID=3132829 RepID=UPI0031192BC4